MRRLCGALTLVMGLVLAGCNKTEEKKQEGPPPGFPGKGFAGGLPGKGFEGKGFPGFPGKDGKGFGGFKGFPGKGFPGAFKPPETKEQPIAVTAGKVTITGDNTRIDFVGTKPGGKHDGGFSKLNGSVQLDPSGKQVASINVTIDTDSIWSDQPMLTNHLKSPDFFEVKAYPQATFVSTKIEPAMGKGGETHTIVGDLTLHGIKKQVSIPATIKLENNMLLIKGSLTINRKDFDVSYSQRPVDDNVAITVQVGVAPVASK
jgi:polyisoprenoid-binding protein YceI